VLAVEVAAYIEGHSGEVDVNGHRGVMIGVHADGTKELIAYVGRNFRVRFRLLDGVGCMDGLRHAGWAGR
jgi:hypothetical protein